MCLGSRLTNSSEPAPTPRFRLHRGTPRRLGRECRLPGLSRWQRTASPCRHPDRSPHRPARTPRTPRPEGHAARCRSWPKWEHHHNRRHSLRRHSAQIHSVADSHKQAPGSAVARWPASAPAVTRFGAYDCIVRSVRIGGTGETQVHEVPPTGRTTTCRRRSVGAVPPSVNARGRSRPARALLALSRRSWSALGGLAWVGCCPAGSTSMARPCL
jgi:hypothetical protein